MSTITNEPILLDSTGREIRDEMKRQNAYLAMLAEGRRSEIYSSMSQIASLVRTSGLEQIQKLFPIGDQIIVPWKDMDDSSHNTDETAYQVAWDIVQHGMVTLQDGSEVPGLYLQMHLCSAYGVQFSHQQAFMMCPDGLSAGTYCVTLGSTWGNKGANAGTSWSFTLTQDVPAGGMLSGFEGMPFVDPSAFKVKSWASVDAVDPIETVSVAAGASGTSLGTLQYTAKSSEGLNCMQRVAYGHNRWDTSAIRQYLNASGESWWKPKEDFDVRPDQYNKKGFMTGFGQDFLNAIKPVKVTTALNTVEGYVDTTVDTYDRFFLPSLEQMNISPQIVGVEGDFFPYWRKRLAMNGFAGTESSNIYDAFKIPAINSASSQYVRLRSAVRGNASHAWLVFSAGSANNSGGSDALRFSPVCVIC